MSKRPHNTTKLHAWQSALGELADQVQAWAEARRWLVHRTQKTIKEEQTGRYKAPYLTIQTPQGRIVVDPIGLDVVGAVGRVDVYAWPSLNEVLLVDFEQGWRVLDRDRDRVVGRWNEATFAKLVERLAAAA